MAATNVQAFSGDVEITSNLEVGTANLFVDTVNSRVGIGTSGPANSLHICKVANEQTSGLFLEKINNGTGAAALFFGVNHTSENPGVAKGAIYYERYLGNGRGDLKFCNDASTDANNVSTAAGDCRMVIRNDGNIGIGTTNPDGPLHVNIPSNSNFNGITYQVGDVKTVLGNTIDNSTNASFLQVYAGVTNSVPIASSNKYNFFLQPLGGGVTIGSNASPSCGVDIRSSSGTRCSYPFGVGGNSAYASYTHTAVSVANNASGWTKSFTVGSYERGGWIRVYSGATSSTVNPADVLVQSPQYAEFVYSVMGNYVNSNRISGSANITLTSGGYQVVTVNVQFGGSYPWGWVEIWQQGGVLIY